MAAPVVGNDTKAPLPEEEHLGVPVVGTQRPAVAENNGLTAAPVLVMNVCAVVSGDVGQFPSPSMCSRVGSSYEAGRGRCSRSRAQQGCGKSVERGLSGLRRNCVEPLGSAIREPNEDGQDDELRDQEWRLPALGGHAGQGRALDE